MQSLTNGHKAEVELGVRLSVPSPSSQETGHNIKSLCLGLRLEDFGGGAVDAAQLVECLPSMHETLSLVCRTW